MVIAAAGLDDRIARRVPLPEIYHSTNTSKDINSAANQTTAAQRAFVALGSPTPRQARMGTASAAPEHHVLACVLWASVFALVFSQSWPALVLILSVLSVAVFNDQPDLGAPGSSLSATADDGKPPRAPDTPSPLRHPPMAPPPAADPAGLWEVRPSPGRGLGVFACRAIPRGTRVLEEPPLFAVTPPVPPDTAAAAARVTAAFAALPPAGRAAHLACHDGGAPARRPRALRVFRANAFTLPDGRWAMFERHARLNHSCLPNVANAWAAAAGTDGAEGRKVAWALRDIAPGEELLVTYVRLLQTAPARAARLGQYGFRCVCAACAGPDAAAMSVRRAAMGDTLEELEAASTAPEDVLEPC